jgi:RNA polymerase sigma factor (TIGR02999 family)
MSTDSGEITRLLRAHRDGDAVAFDELIPLVHDHLQRLARSQLRRLPPGGTLDTVALVNETYLRMVNEAGVDWQDRAHFFGITARAMRRVVVDHARAHFAQKRGGGQLQVTLDPELMGVSAEAEKTEQAAAVLAIQEALEKMATFDERLVRIVECRFFAGMSGQEIAAALGISERTVDRDWRRARAWLLKLLDDGGASPPSGSSDAL